MIGDPPSEAGGANETLAEPFPAVATAPVGAPGVEADGVTALDGVDAGPVPALFVAVTVKV